MQEPNAPEPTARTPKGQRLQGIAIGIGIATLAFASALFLRISLNPADSEVGASSPDAATTPRSSTQVDPGQAHGEAQMMTPETAARVAELETKIGQAPSDLSNRKQLAVLLAEAGQFMPAYRQAEAILDVSPDDPDGLYVLAIVRLRMGQNQMATELLDRLLDDYPNHVGALSAKGMVLLRSGNPQGAVTLWERGLAAAGGSHPELERLLRVSQAASGESQAPAETPPSSSPAVEPAANDLSGFLTTSEQNNR